MSRRAVSIVTMWLLMSMLVQATGRPLLRTPAAPAVQALHVERLGHWSAANVVDLDVLGNRAFVANNLGSSPAVGYIHVLDVSNPANPKETVPEQRIEAGFDREVLATSADESLIHMATDNLEGGDSQLQAHRRDDLQWVCLSILFTNRAVEMWASGGYWFVAHEAGLDVIDPPLEYQYAACQRVGYYFAGGSDVTAAAYTATHAYLGTEEGRLLIVDITDPKKPTEKSRSLLLPGNIDAMANAPGVVYLAQGSTIRIVDVSNPAFPFERESLNNPLAVTQLGVANSYLYAASEEGFHIFDVGDSSSPTLAGYYLAPAEDGFGGALFLANDLVYTGGPGGMNILRFTPDAQLQAALLAQPTAPGQVLLNGEQLPYPCELQMPDQDVGASVEEQECPECKEGYIVKWLAKAGSHRLYMYLACFVTNYTRFFELVQVENEGPYAEAVVSLAVVAAHFGCGKLLGATPSSTASAALVLEHESGALRYTFLQDALSAEVKTDAVAIRSDGANTVAVDHDPLVARSTVRCYSGSVLLTPSNASLPPFALPAHQEVEVTKESVSPFQSIDYAIFLPLSVRGIGGGPPRGWTTLLREDFEGGIPGDWLVGDGRPGFGAYYWASRNCRPHDGGRSAWAVGGGADGAALPCGSHYPANAESWMIAGPFDLSDASAAEVSFQRWLNSEPGDLLLWMASADGTDFQGWQDWGAQGTWRDTVFDLANVPGLGDLTGDPDVWIAFVYASDAAGSQPEGAYVDDIVVRKYVPAAGAAQSALSQGVRQAGPREAEGLRPVMRVLPGEGVAP